MNCRPADLSHPHEPLLDDERRTQLAAALHALADPVRLGIVDRLAQGGETCVCHLVEGSGVSQPTVSHHLRILRQAGLVSARRSGTWAHYRLEPDALAALAELAERLRSSPRTAEDAA